MKYFFIPVVLILVHATLVTLTAAHIVLGHPEDAMAWCLFFVIDFPLSRLIFPPPPIFESSSLLIAIPILFLGTIQWATIGIGIQTLVNWFRRSRLAG